MKQLITGILFSLLALPSLGQQSEEAFALANNHYQEGNFEEAKDIYEQVLLEGLESPTLYYNLGNSNFKLGDIPEAILNYERSLKLNASDEDVQFNLRLAQLRLIDKVEPIPAIMISRAWNNFSSTFDSDTWGILLIVLLWLSLISIGAFVLSSSTSVKRLMFTLGLAFLGLGILSATLAQHQYNYENSEDEAIVFAESVYIKSAPDESSTDLFILHEGVKIRLIDELGSWVKFKLADGKVGWLEKEKIKNI